MAVLQQAGRIAMAKAVAAQTIHIAWGRGLPAWDDTPEPEPVSAVGLVDEIGRRLVTEVLFVKPDVLGDIELPSGNKYSISAEPTTYLLLRATFGFTDAEGENVREMGVFFGTQLKAEVPAGTRWVLPAQLDNPGEIYTLERRTAVYRSGATRQVEEIILPF